MKNKLSFIIFLVICITISGGIINIMILLHSSIKLLRITNILTLTCLLILIFHYKILNKTIWKIIEPKYSKSSFLKKINHKGNLLDVGCGNNSPYNTKKEYPGIMYTGIDVGDYNQTKINLADDYIVVKPENFAEAIASMPKLFDTVISSHNLEHCNDREKTLDSIIKILKPGGYLFLSFPTEESINFPSRKGTLNYYDDSTHKDKPPEYDKIISKLKTNNIQILFANKSYKPFFWYLIGFFLEWKSKKDKEVKTWTWAYWGFETIIWAKKMNNPGANSKLDS